MRLVVPKQTDWTASGALDWGFPHSAEVERVGEWMDTVVSDP